MNEVIRLQGTGLYREAVLLNGELLQENPVTKLDWGYNGSACRWLSILILDKIGMHGNGYIDMFTNIIVANLNPYKFDVQIRVKELFDTLKKQSKEQKHLFDFIDFNIELDPEKEPVFIPKFLEFNESVVGNYEFKSGRVIDEFKKLTDDQKVMLQNYLDNVAMSVFSVGNKKTEKVGTRFEFDETLKVYNGIGNKRIFNSICLISNNN